MLNIASFLTLPHLLDRWGVVDSYEGVGGGGGDRGWVLSVSLYFFILFVLLSDVLSLF